MLSYYDNEKKMNKKIKVLLYTNGLLLLASSMLGPVYALFLDGKGANLFEASLAMVIFSVVAGITTFFMGKVADRKDPKKIMIIGYFLIGLAFLLYNFVDSLSTIYLLQVLIGLGEAIYAPSFDKLYTESMHKKNAGEVWGAWELANYFSQSIGAFVGGYLSYYFGFNFIFTMISMLCFLSTYWVYKSKELSCETTRY